MHTPHISNTRTDVDGTFSVNYIRYEIFVLGAEVGLDSCLLTEFYSGR